MPVGTFTAIALAAAWTAATIACLEVSSGFEWLVEGLVALVFREVWLRAREHRATRARNFSPERGVKLGWEGVVVVYIQAALCTSVLGFMIPKHAALLSVWFLALRLATHFAELRRSRESASAG
jgi:hypothetical protein